MVIAVNTKGVPGNMHNGDWIVESVLLLASQYPEHHFIFIATEADGKKITAGKNIQKILAEPGASNVLVLKLWYNYKLPALLKKHKAAVVIHTSGICSVRTKLPQLLLVPDLSFLIYPGWFSKKYLRFFTSNTKAFLDKATSVIIRSALEKQALIKKYSVDDTKASVLFPSADEAYQPVGWKEKEALKEKYAGGKEYFLFAGIPDERSNIINLLKAYSFFKKRQKSSMQLVIVITGESPANKIFKESLRLYKFRAEVQLVEDASSQELSKIMAAAYALVHPVLYENDTTTLLNAMQAEVPVIASSDGAIPEVCGDAALYTASEKMEDIAAPMMLVFKDENKRNAMIEKGKIQAQHFDRQKTACILWDMILKAKP